MKIAHVVPTYWPAVRYGGPIYSVHGLCRQLAALGVDVDVYTTNVDGPSVLDVAVGEGVDVDGVTVRYFKTGAGRRIFRSPELARALESRIGEYDLVHTHSLFLWPVFAASRIARRHGVACVSSPRGMLVRDLIRHKSTLAKKLWIALIEKRNLENAASIHVTSETERQDIAEFDIAYSRIATIPNGIDAKEFTSVGDVSLNPEPTILCLGRISWKKGLDRMIRALPRLPKMRLILAGNDEEGYSESLQALASELGVRDRVDFRGPVYGAQKRALFESCHIFALPSRSENFANVVLEAMACARPVLVTREVGMAEVVSREKCGTVVAGDPQIIAQEINELFASPDRMRAMGKAGRRAAQTQFDWDAVGRLMLDEYRSLLRRGSADEHQNKHSVISDLNTTGQRAGR